MNQLDLSAARDPGEVLIDLALKAPRKCVGIVGLAKNCGKTTVLNTMIRQAASRGIVVGVTSGGRDGELYDAITGLPKPPIYLPEGSLVALAECTIRNGSCSLDVVKRLGVWTPAGEILVAKAVAGGHVEVIGCNHSQDLITAAGQMKELGAELVLVDGAAGRTFLASPDIVGSFVLATGAALNGSVQEIAESTETAVHMFQLPQPSEDVACAAEPIVREGRSGVLRAGGSIEILPWKTILGKERDVVSLLREDDVALICGRAVGDALLAAIAGWLRTRRQRASSASKAPVWSVVQTGDSSGIEQHGIAAPGESVARSQAFAVVARDPSRVAAGSDLVALLEMSGGQLCVLDKALVCAITANPTSPWRAPFNPEELVVEISRHVRGLPVLDVVAGLSALGGVACETQPRD